MEQGAHLGSKLALLATLALAGIQPSVAAGGPILMRLCHEKPADFWLAGVLADWGRAVETATHGAVRVQILPNEEGFKAVDYFAAVKAGKIEAAVIEGPDFEAVPELSVLFRPYSEPNAESLERFFDSPLMRALNERIDASGVRSIGMVEVSCVQAIMSTRNALILPEDYHGAHIRTFSDFLFPSFQAMGASPVKISGRDAVMKAFNNGTLTGMLTDISNSYKFGPDIRHVTATQMANAVGIICVNPAWWGRLPEAVKTDICETTRKIESKSVSEALAAAEKEIRTAIAKGIEVHKTTPAEVTALKAAMDPPFDRGFRDRMGAEADLLLAQVGSLED